MSRNPLFQVMFVLQNTPEAELHLAGLDCESLTLHNGTAKFDLSLSLTETRGELHGILEYSTDLFDAASIERLAGHFTTLLEGIVADPEQHIGLLPLLTEAERHQLLVGWNDTAVDYPRDKCVHELFEAQAARAPEPSPSFTGTPNSPTPRSTPGQTNSPIICAVWASAPTPWSASAWSARSTWSSACWPSSRLAAPTSRWIRTTLGSASPSCWGTPGPQSS